MRQAICEIIICSEKPKALPRALQRFALANELVLVLATPKVKTNKRRMPEKSIK
jgi:hypothetical protein